MKTLFVILASLFIGQSLLASPWVLKSKPTYRGDRLDWCKSFADDCGRPAVDAYCEYLGYKGSKHFKIDANIGRTRLISGPVCEDSFCDGFSYLYCKRHNYTYNKPKEGSDRLDYCKDWASNCGKPAADAFCKKKGWSQSYAHKIDANIGRTRLITGAVCEDSFCDGFAYIRCK